MSSHPHETPAAPPYTVVVNPRAKAARITVSPRRGVVVTVPPDRPDLDPASLVEQRRAWIQEALDHYREARAAFLTPAAHVLPGRVTFAATGESWPVEYGRGTGARVSARVHGDVLRVSHDAARGDEVLHALQRWLHRQAVAALVPRCHTLAVRLDIQPAGVGVRGQHARWGGCSARGFITLNRALLFLEPDLVDAAIAHELAHVAQPNHSAEFWDHLGTLDPAFGEHARLISEAWDRVPAWAEPR